MHSAGSEGYAKKACRTVHDAELLKVNFWPDVEVFAARQCRLGHKDRFAVCQLAIRLPANIR